MVEEGEQTNIMARHLTNKIAKEHKENAVNSVNEYLNDLMDRDNLPKTDKLCYWIEEWVKYLAFEEIFNPRSLKRYKRGEVIRANLGFNIGSEYGGLHFCVVLDKNNSPSSPVVTVVPLTSLKEGVDPNKLYPGSVYLGDQVYQKLLQKGVIAKMETINSAMHLKNELKKTRESLDNPYPPQEGFDEWRKNTSKVLKCYEENKHLFEEIGKKLKGMKRGSIALVGQIRTISKIRIYEPKTSKDPLSNIRISDSYLNAIDNEIRKLYTGF